MFLYKYYSPNSYDYIFTPKGITVRFSQPSVLNDIFEANGSLDLSSDEKLLAYLKAYIKKEVDFEKFVKGYFELPETFKEMLQNSIKNRQLDYEKKESDIIGILSLSENKNSRTMWSYYADSHRGYMIEYAPDLTESYFDFAYFSNKVTYTKDRPLSLTEYLLKNGALDVEKQANDFFTALWSTKDKEWENEQEFRVMASINQIPTTGVDNDGYPIHAALVPTEIVKAIYLGARASDSLKRKIAHWIRTHSPTVELYQAKPCPTKYEMLYEPIQP